MAATHSTSAETGGQLFNTTKYSDLTINCGPEKYALHRAIVCPRVKRLDEVCNKSSEETSHVIEFEANDPETLNRMLIFLYTNDYPDGEIPQHQRPSIAEEYITTHTHTRTATPSAMKKREEVHQDDKLMNNVLVYAIAEQYGLPQLQELARSRVQMLSSAEAIYNGTSEFGDVVRTAFEFTSAEDHGLRDIFIQLCADKFPDVLQHAGLETVVQSVAPLSFGMLERKSRIDAQRLLDELDSKTMLERDLSMVKAQLKEALDSKTKLEQDLSTTKAQLKEAVAEKRAAVAEKESAISQRKVAVEMGKVNENRYQDAFKSIKHHSDLQSEAIKQKDIVVNEKVKALIARDTANRHLAQMTVLKTAAERTKNEAIKARDAAVQEKNEAIRQRNAFHHGQDGIVAVRDEQTSYWSGKLLETVEKIIEWQSCRNCHILFGSYVQKVPTNGEFAVQLRCRTCQCRHDIGHGTA